MDHAMVRYKLGPFSDLVHDLIVKNLVEKKGYDERLLETKYQSKWCQKGLVLDKRRGHILRIGSNYQILKACHGSRFLTQDEIAANYGQNGIYEPLKDTLIHYMENGSSWESPFLVLKDFFSTPYASLFVDIVDLVGPRDDYSSICHDIYDVLVMMYHRRAMLEGTGGFFTSFQKDPSEYLYQASEEHKLWLKSLRKEGAKLFLLTSSNSDFANLLMEHTFKDKEWKSYFDIIVTYAKKPHFFTSRNPFHEVDANDGDGSVVESREMCLNTTYCKGNQHDLQDLFSRTLGKSSTQVLYFGDSVFDDIYAPSTVGWDCAVILEELDENSRSELQSVWGSFFRDEDHSCDTLFFNITKSKAVLAVPSIQSVVDLEPTVSLNKDTSKGVVTWTGLSSCL